MTLKTTTILIMMVLIMLVPVMAATPAEEEGNELQLTAIESSQDNISQSQQTDSKGNTPFVIIGLVLLGLWYYKNKSGGKQK